MQGLHILTERSIMHDGANTILAIGITLIVVFVFWIITERIVNEGVDMAGFKLGCVMLGIAMVLIAVMVIPKRTQIKAWYDDSLKFDDLWQRYEVIESDGNLLTLIERENNEGH